MAKPEHLAILRDALNQDDISIWNNWRIQNPYIQPDLRGANLSKANLSQVDFAGALLDSTDLSFTNLSFSILIHADLSFANLSVANLTFAPLQYANFEGAILQVTNFADVDFANVLNLDQADVRRPCTIGIDTLYKSKGNIPESFLRACGVPDDVIALSVSIRGTIQYYKTFISYSHQDMKFARRLHDTLQGRGIRCWRDEKQIKPGKIIREEVYKGIRYHEKLLLLCSKDSLNSPAVEEEIEHIFSDEDAERKRLQAEADEAGNTDKIDIPLRLIPIDIDDYLFSPECHSRYKHRITSRLAARFTGWEKDNAIFEDQIEKVIWALEMD